MSAGTVKLGQAQLQGLTALRRAVRKLPVRSAAELRLGEADPGADDREVVVVVLGSSGGLVARTELATAVPRHALRTVLLGAEVAAERLAARPMATAEAPPLPAGEAAVLDRAGLVTGKGEADPLARASIDLDLMLRESPTLEE